MNKKFWVMSELGSLISMYRSDGATSENCPKNSLTFCRLTKPKKGKVVLPSYVISIPTSHTWFTLSLSLARTFAVVEKIYTKKMDPEKEEFLKEFGSDYGYPTGPKSIDQIRATEFKRLDGQIFSLFSKKISILYLFSYCYYFFGFSQTFCLAAEKVKENYCCKWI